MQDARPQANVEVTLRARPRDAQDVLGVRVEVLMQCLDSVGLHNLPTLTHPGSSIGRASDFQSDGSGFESPSGHAWCKQPGRR
jgi:hypothetical protein